ncbi:DedA family protein [Halorubrum saccharovorum DSM 1137]|uniref:DedA family protein n=1 Tax=Halorubrum saccharovorum DSM 1137 TaxID=1227484 RepID=M0E6P9_9EURY|nr:VTT domain-containing protein [Halorubrum saccharovorum]ELZ43466.1 DedA family protein [Halorubrum saccharovorum DSM 1137]
MIPTVPPLSVSAILSSIELSREFFISLGAPGLLLLGFLEFFFFPIPPMLVLIPLTVASPELALVYAAAATMGSVTAGVAGFALGHRGGRPILTSRFSANRIGQAERYLEQRGFATVAFGSFAPIPEAHELLSITAGSFNMRFRTYIVAAVLGRGSKYFIVAMLSVALGQAARSLTEVEVYSILAVAVVVAGVGYALRGRLRPRPIR